MESIELGNGGEGTEREGLMHCVWRWGMVYDMISMYLMRIRPWGKMKSGTLYS